MQGLPSHAKELSRGLHPLGTGTGTQGAATWTASSRTLSLLDSCMVSFSCLALSRSQPHSGRMMERVGFRAHGERRAVPGGRAHAGEARQASTALLCCDCPAGLIAGNNAILQLLGLPGWVSGAWRALSHS